MPDYLPISFVCRGDRPHTHTHKNTCADVIPLHFVRGFLPSLMHPSLLPPLVFVFLSFLFHFLSSLPLQLPSFLSPLTSLSFSFLSVCSLLFSLPHLKPILSPSGEKSGCIYVMTRFKSHKEDCTNACAKLIFHSFNVSACIFIFFFSMHALTNLCRVCVYIFNHVSICPHDAM